MIRWALIISLLITGGVAVNSPPVITQPAEHAAADSRPDRDVLVTGSISDGTDAISEATVTAYVWPTEAQIETGTEDAVELIEVATDVTDADGAYHITRTPALVSHVDNNPDAAYVDLTVVTDGPAGEATSSVSIPTQSVNLVVDRNAETAMEGPEGATRGPAVLDLRTRPAPSVTTRGEEPTAGCPYRYKNLGPARVEVGQTHSLSSRARTDFRYASSAESTIGVAVSSGGWRASGTKTITTNVGLNFRHVYGYSNRVHETSFMFRKYCTFLPKPGVYRYYVRPAYHIAGGASYFRRAPSTSYCSDLGYGITTSAGSARAVKYSRGADTGKFIGFDLSSQTGYSSTAEWIYKAHSGALDLCGTNAYPGAAAVVVAKTP